MLNLVFLAKIMLYSIRKLEFLIFLRSQLSVELDEFALKGVETFEVKNYLLVETFGNKTGQMSNISILLSIEKS